MKKGEKFYFNKKKEVAPNYELGTGRKFEVLGDSHVLIPKILGENVEKNALKTKEIIPNSGNQSRVETVEKSISLLGLN